MPLLTVVDWMEVAPVSLPAEKRFFSAGSETFLECKKEGESWQVERLISTNLSDYLNPAFQPGSVYNQRI